MIKSRDERATICHIFCDYFRQVACHVKIKAATEGKVAITGNYYNSWQSGAMLATHA